MSTLMQKKGFTTPGDSVVLGMPNSSAKLSKGTLGCFFLIAVVGVILNLGALQSMVQREMRSNPNFLIFCFSLHLFFNKGVGNAGL